MFLWMCEVFLQLFAEKPQLHLSTLTYEHDPLMLNNQKVSLVLILNNILFCKDPPASPKFASEFIKILFKFESTSVFNLTPILSDH